MLTFTTIQVSFVCNLWLIRSTGYWEGTSSGSYSFKLKKKKKKGKTYFINFMPEVLLCGLPSTGTFEVKYIKVKDV